MSGGAAVGQKCSQLTGTCSRRSGSWHTSGAILAAMMTKLTIILLALGVLIFAVAFQYPGPASTAPQYTSVKEMKFPENYREWVYLTTGFDMAYGPGSGMGHHMFDNVFVNPEAYKSFQQTGTWPDKTVFVLEVRGAKDKESINKAGHFQSVELMGM